MCMRMNVSQTMNPGFWRDWSFVRELHYAHGYRTGLFGKVLNDMADYGCDGKSTTDGVDRTFAMCAAQYVNQSWIDKGAPDSPASGLRRTGNSPSEYTTSLVGNATLKACVEAMYAAGKVGREADLEIGHSMDIAERLLADHCAGSERL